MNVRAIGLVLVRSGGWHGKVSRLCVSAEAPEMGLAARPECSPRCCVMVSLDRSADRDLLLMAGPAGVVVAGQREHVVPRREGVLLREHQLPATVAGGHALAGRICDSPAGDAGGGRRARGREDDRARDEPGAALLHRDLAALALDVRGDGRGDCLASDQLDLPGRTLLAAGALRPGGAN